MTSFKVKFCICSLEAENCMMSLKFCDSLKMPFVSAKEYKMQCMLVYQAGPR